jgi:hypothetical protein
LFVADEEEQTFVVAAVYLFVRALLEMSGQYPDVGMIQVKRQTEREREGTLC